MVLRKSFAPLALGILILIIVLLLLIFPLILLSSLKINLVADVDLSYKTNLADDILLEFLEWKPNYRYITELGLSNFKKYWGISNSQAIGLMRAKLHSISQSNCFTSNIGFGRNKVEDLSDCSNVENITLSNFILFLPYNPYRLTTNVHLEVGI